MSRPTATFPVPNNTAPGGLGAPVSMPSSANMPYGGRPSPISPYSNAMPGMSQAPPRSTLPQAYPQRSLSPQRLPGQTPGFNNQISRNVIPSGPTMTGSPNYTYGLPAGSQPYLSTGSRLNPTMPMIPGSNVGFRQTPMMLPGQRPLSPAFAGSRLTGQPFLQPQPIMPTGFGVSGVRIGQPLYQGSGVRIGQPIAGQRSYSSRIEYVPYSKKIVDYEPQQVYSSMWVPVQKKCLNYYGIQHITQYIPREVDDFRYQLVPQQQYYYRLQYVPVQKDIIHLPYEGTSTNQVGYYPQGFTQGILNPYERSTLPYNYQQRSPSEYVPGYKPLLNTLSTNTLLPRTNYVTSDGYVPSYMRPESAIPNYLPFNQVGPYTGINPNIGYLGGPGNPGYNSLNPNTSNLLSKPASQQIQKGLANAFRQYSRSGLGDFGPTNVSGNDQTIDRGIGQAFKQIAQRGSLERGNSMNQSRGFF